MLLSPSAHVDTFTRDSLPPVEAWPRLEFTLDELRYPDRLNAAVELLDRTIDRFGPDRIVLRGTSPDGADETWTYGALRDRVDQVAHVLVDDYGIVPGNRVVLRVPNNPWAVVLWLAVLKAGAVVVMTMTAWHAHELAKVAARTRPSLLIVDHRHPVDAPADLRVAVLGGADDAVWTAADAKPTRFEAVATAADDVALLGPTSGTTGEPKVTMHFHRDILAIADTFGVRVLGLQPDDVSAGSPPLAFTFGLGGLVIFPMRTGGSAVLLERPSPTALADLVDSHGVTVLYTAPTGYRAILKSGRADALSRLRIGVSAGEHLPKETFEDVERASGLRLVNGIGATEMLHVFISAAGDEIRPGATGRPIPGFRAAVLDDDGNEVRDGTPGRLAVIGPTGCRYLADERQAVYVQNGWNITGDAYIRDADGYFHYQARTDDIIVTAGYNVGAPEVEAVLDEHPAVVESAVVGRPDPDKGFIVNAFVVLAPGAEASDALVEELQAHAGTRLTRYKVPRRIDFVEALPRNASGKLQRFPLRERAAREAAESAPQAVLTGGLK